MNVDGNSLPKSPEFSGNVWARYSLPVGEVGNVSRNLTDDLATLDATENFFGLVETYGPPRTYGVEVGYTY